ncbi:MAG: acyl--CoA ligase [Firmicutes bacterium]|nr:acyl--CoA ligase [Bacillota bacterium]
MVITDLLSRNAALYGDEVSLVEISPAKVETAGLTWHEYDMNHIQPAVDFRREMTWREFDDQANRFANFLLSRNLGKGKKVAILMVNCLEWLPIYFGILKAGALAVPLNFRYTADEIKYCLQLSQSDALIFGEVFTQRIEAIKDGLPEIQLWLFLGENKPDFAEDYPQVTTSFSAEAPAVDLQPEDDAAIYFSSGTTGFPKAILHDHASLYSACVTEQKHHGQTRKDNFLCIPPLYHTGAKMHWFGSLISGGKAVLLCGVKPQWIMQAISDEKATIVWLLVPWAQDILDSIESGLIDLGEYHLDQLRLMHIGAQPVPPSLVKRWLRYFPNHDYDTNYGLSESIGPGCVHLGVGNIDKVGAIGKAGYHWQTKIVDENKNPVPQGAVGELAVKGPGVMKCYFNDVEATEAVLQDGWLFTGDMAKTDEDGFIYLVDRKKDVIISGGENIYPVQIEDFLRANEAVKDVAVIGIPDKRLGEIPAAIIEVKENYTLDKQHVDSFCQDLPRYKRPKRVIFAEVPRNPTGKIEKPKLREMYCGEGLIASQLNS